MIDGSDIPNLQWGQPVRLAGAEHGVRMLVVDLEEASVHVTVAWSWPETGRVQERLFLKSDLEPYL